MNNNQKNKCLNCGFDNNLESSFCTNCGNTLNKMNSQNNFNNVVNTNDNQNLKTGANSNINNNYNRKDKTNANILGTISLILYFAGGSIILYLRNMLGNSITPISRLLETIGGLCPLAGITVMIVGRVIYPQNTFLKIVMWFIIVSFILLVIAFIILTIACAVTCSSFKSLG